MQIHGEIRFRDHIEALVVHHSHANDEGIVRMVNLFSSRYEIPVVWMARDTGKVLPIAVRMDEVTERAAQERAAQAIQNREAARTRYHDRSRAVVAYPLAPTGPSVTVTGPSPPPPVTTACACICASWSLIVWDDMNRLQQRQ